MGISVLLSDIPSSGQNAKAKSDLESFVNKWINGQDGIKITPKGLSWSDKYVSIAINSW